MSTTAVRRPRHGSGESARDLLTRRYEDTCAMLRSQEERVATMRDNMDHTPGDEVDRATRRAELDEEVSLAHTLQIRVADLDIAVRRWDQGAYGVCERCAQPIPAERLEVFPAATHCVACKSALERR